MFSHTQDLYFKNKSSKKLAFHLRMKALTEITFNNPRFAERYQDCLPLQSAPMV